MISDPAQQAAKELCHDIADEMLKRYALAEPTTGLSGSWTFSEGTTERIHEILADFLPRTIGEDFFGKPLRLIQIASYEDRIGVRMEA